MSDSDKRQRLNIPSLFKMTEAWVHAALVKQAQALNPESRTLSTPFEQITAEPQYVGMDLRVGPPSTMRGRLPSISEEEDGGQ